MEALSSNTQRVVPRKVSLVASSSVRLGAHQVALVMAAVQVESAQHQLLPSMNVTHLVRPPIHANDVSWR
eukprot:2016100-Prymnesium_polylepis.1